MTNAHDKQHLDGNEVDDRTEASADVSKEIFDPSFAEGARKRAVRSAAAGDWQHHVVRGLVSFVEAFERTTRQPDFFRAHRAVLAYGRPFTGVVRPTGYRPRAEGRCFYNAGRLACEQRGTYVEGFALSLGGADPVHHAWLTLDGSDAVDVTWRGPIPQCHYFGIQFHTEVLARFCRQGQGRRYWGALLGDETLDQALSAIGLKAPRREHRLPGTGCCDHAWG
jgi:hypothetical protein